MGGHEQIHHARRIADPDDARLDEAIEPLDGVGPGPARNLRKIEELSAESLSRLAIEVEVRLEPDERLGDLVIALVGVLVEVVQGAAERLGLLRAGPGLDLVLAGELVELGGAADGASDRQAGSGADARPDGCAQLRAESRASLAAGGIDLTRDLRLELAVGEVGPNRDRCIGDGDRHS
jgi:hypothetical protein